MFLIDTDQAVASRPAPAAPGTLSGWFTDDAPGSSDGTVVSADWLNMLQGELLSILTAADMTPNKTLINQVLTAIIVIIAAQFTINENQNGYIEFPGGFVLEWGNNTTSAGSRLVTFQEAFTTSCLFVICGAGAAGSYSTGTIITGTITAANFTAYGGVAETGTASNVGFYWIAGGYSGA